MQLFVNTKQSRKEPRSRRSEDIVGTLLFPKPQLQWDPRCDEAQTTLVPFKDLTGARLLCKQQS